MNLAVRRELLLLGFTSSQYRKHLYMIMPGKDEKLCFLKYFIAVNKNVTYIIFIINKGSVAQTV